MNNEQIGVLDHGYITLVETWGSDERIIEAARMSTNKGFQGWGPKHAPTCPYSPPSDDSDKLSLAFQDCNCLENTPGDEKLLSYLWRNKHHTPFEMAGATFEIQAPIFVFREWHRHRTQSYNEMSARYTPLPDVNYLPSDLRCIPQSQINKQASGTSDKIPSREEVEEWLESLSESYRISQACYESGLSLGIPKEIARLSVPVARYSKMRASANLRNWLGFLTLRMDQHAQWEIRQYANIVHQLLSVTFPRTIALFDEGRAVGGGKE